MGGNRRRSQAKRVRPGVHAHQHPQCLPCRSDYFRAQRARLLGPEERCELDPFYRGGSQEKIFLPPLEFLLLPAPRTGTGSVLTGRAICANAEHGGGPAISVFSLNGFHRFFRDEASPVRNSQAERLLMATMVLFGTRGPLLCQVIRGA